MYCTLPLQLQIRSQHLMKCTFRHPQVLIIYSICILASLATKAQQTHGRLTPFVSSYQTTEKTNGLQDDSIRIQKSISPELAKTSTLYHTNQGADACEANPAEISPLNPLRDLRGAWLTSVFNLDWPTNRTATPAVHQAELLKIFDTLRNAGFNTVFLQVRTGSDAFYASPYEPWSYYLTGTEGLAPSPFWDPLSFAVEAAHARGLDIHAWINPYRARTGSFSLSPNHVINQNPGLILTIGSNLILNPGLPQVRTHITTVVADIATRYDVDGIHFDDYFYPSAINTEDAGTYAANNPKGIPTVADWRRDNVNQLIAKVYDTLQQINQVSGRNLVFGVSPFGIWKSGTPAGISGTSSYSAFYCDPIAWLQAGKVDYLAPQLYWKIGGAQDYSILSQWWNDQGKQYGRHIYPGLAWYKMVDANNWSVSEIENQIYLNRQPERNEIRGEVGYRTAQLMADSKGLKTALQQGQYRYKSYAPAFGWKDNTCPNAPIQLWLVGDTLSWQAPSPAADGDTAVKYVVYRFLNEQEAVLRKQDGTKVVDIVATNKLYLPQAGYYRYVVSALDKNNNESEGIISAMPNVVLCPGGSVNLSAMITGTFYQWQYQNNGNWEALAPSEYFAGTTSDLLQITNLPVSHYGRQLRCLSNGTDSGSVYTLTFGTTWTATLNGSWSQGSNWSCGTPPDKNVDVYVAGNQVPFPTIDIPEAEARSVWLRNGARLQVPHGNRIIIGNK
jgi:uncharacterized lipoprotein YddW (UPF0748 family)